MKTDKLKKLILGLLLLTILGYCYYTFYLNSEMSRIGELRASVTQKKDTVRSLKGKKAGIDLEISRAKEQSAKMDKAIPDQFDNKVIIAYFYNLIKSYGLSGDKITIAESGANAQGYKFGTATFKVEGGYDAIRGLMKQIENDDRKFVIKQALLSEGEKNMYSLSMTVEFYSLK